MSALLAFQQEHGDAWTNITNSPAFIAAMQLLNVEKINAITALSPEEIEAKGKLVLADLVGHLNHENNLATLGTRKEFKFTELPPPDYPDPEDEVELPAENPDLRQSPKHPKPRKRKS